MRSNDIKELFKARGIKNTQQRHEIYDFLSKKVQPITAEEIYIELSKKEKTRMNLSTVYRILDTFIKAGLVLKSGINIEGKSTYEINHMDHRHHLVCVRCNKILPIKGCPLGGYENYLGEKTGFKILEHHLEIKGICPECREKMEPKDNQR
ncbi:MAG: Fur family transcriptional regulator [Bacillota bacterium]